MNNNFIRQPQGNRQRNRNRPRHNNNRSGSSNGTSGGNSSNRVFDSNGPDVKVRGTAQTVAEKYMQLGRDAQSSGDTVAAETYYQHAEHYYRLWAANQPAGASLIMSRKLGEEEFEEDGAAEEGGEEMLEGQVVEGSNLDNPENPEPATIADGLTTPDGQPQPRNSNSNNRNTRERFRPRWPKNRDRYGGQDGTPDAAGPAPATSSEPVAVSPPAGDDSGQWEAPSFLQRPAPSPSVEPEAEGASQPEARRPRPRRARDDQPPAPEDASFTKTE